MALTTVSPGLLDSTAQYYSFKNRIINGAMGIWQRGTSFAAPANLAYTADRWFSIWGTANRTISRQAGFSGSQYCMRVARNSGTTDAAYSGVIQIIETNNLIDLQGQTVTLSFSARRGANYSAASNAMIVYLQCGTAADQGSSVYWSPGWTGLTSPIVSNVTLSTTEQTFSLQAAIPANCQEIAITFQYLSAGTAGANDYFEITNVQLEKGSTATSFDYRPYGTELALCQRYYFRYDGGQGSGTYAFCSGSIYGATTTLRAYLKFPVTMRAGPTLSYAGALVGSGGSNDNNVSAIATQFTGTDSALVDFTVAAGTVGQGKIIYVTSAAYGTNFIQGAAEL